MKESKTEDTNDPQELRAQAIKLWDEGKHKEAQELVHKALLYENRKYRKYRKYKKKD